MFIQKLRLENWLSHVDTTLTFERTTGLRGENGSGKTSVEAAIEYILTGRSVQTDDKGSGARELIRRGADKAVLTVDFVDSDKRALRMRCSVTEKSGRTIAIKDPADESWTGGDYLNNFAARREVLDCLLNSHYFLDMDDARQKKLLAGILLPAIVDLEEWVRPALAECGLTIDWSLRAFDLITAAHDKAYNERKVINMLIKEWKEPEAPPAAPVDLRVIRDRLKERQDARTTLAIKKGKIVGKFEDDKKARERAGGKAGELQGKLTTEVQRRAQVAKDELSKGRLKEAEEAVKHLDAAKKLDGLIAETTSELAHVRRDIAKLCDVGEAGKCPTCLQVVSDADFERISAPSAQRQNELITLEGEQQQNRKLLGDPEGAQKLLDAHAQAVKDLALIDGRIRDIEEEIREVTQLNAIAPATEPDTTEINAQLADLDTRIEKGNAALADAIRAEERKATYDAAMESKKKLDAKQETLEKLVAYFGPGLKGIQTKLLDEHVGGFQESMNKVLAGWNFRCQLQFEPFSFRAGLAGSTECFGLRAMSAGQRAMFAAAFQVALAKVTSFNFVCVDDAEVFSADNRKILFKNLVASQLDQVIVMAADVKLEIPRDQDQQPAPGTVFYLLSLDRSGAVPTTKVERLT